MKSKYEKPFARNLGSSLPDAIGRCNAGSVAAGIGNPCDTFGGNASDGGCITYGGGAGNEYDKACTLGNHPNADVGCQLGDTAQKVCSTGTNHF